MCNVGTHVLVAAKIFQIRIRSRMVVAVLGAGIKTLRAHNAHACPKRYRRVRQLDEGTTACASPTGKLRECNGQIADSQSIHTSDSVLPPLGVAGAFCWLQMCLSAHGELYLCWLGRVNSVIFTLIDCQPTITHKKLTICAVPFHTTYPLTEENELHSTKSAFP